MVGWLVFKQFKPRFKILQKMAKIFKKNGQNF